MTPVTVEDKRTAILNATLDLIAEYGFHGAPISQVAKRSGVSNGIIYHYFENKDDLIIQLYKHIKSRFMAALMQGEPYQEDLSENLKKLWFNAYEFCVSHPKETSFLNQYENSPYIHMCYEIQNENVDKLVNMIEQAFEKGLIRPMSFEALYELTMGVANARARRTINGTVQPDPAMLEMVADACLRAVTQ